VEREPKALILGIPGSFQHSPPLVEEKVLPGGNMLFQIN
jgi:hypothetical protein